MSELAKLKETRKTLNTMLKAVEVGQINPYPVIKVYFETLARTAVQRSERGILTILLTDTTKNDKWTTIKSVADLTTENWTEDNRALVQTAFEVFSPYKVMIRRKGEDDVSVFLKELETLKITHLACPELETSDDAKVVAWAKGNTNKRNVVYVSAFADNSDDCRVIKLSNKEVKHKNNKNL